MSSDNMPNMYSWSKDKNNRFMSSCEGLAMLADLDGPASLIHKSDHDLVWGNRVNQYNAGDVIALSGRVVRQHELISVRGGHTLHIVVTKSPLYNAHGHVVGTIGSGIDLTHYAINKSFGINNAGGRICLGQEFGNTYLTNREVDTLREILLGGTCATIALRLNISKRTVEQYIDTLKLKLQCKTKGDIIATAVQSGLSHTVLTTCS